jgi:hypothetical protein
MTWWVVLLLVLAGVFLGLFVALCLVFWWLKDMWG